MTTNIPITRPAPTKTGGTLFKRSVCGTLALGTLLGSLILPVSGYAQSQSPSQGFTPPLRVPTFPDATLVEAGCDKEVWDSLNRKYIAKRTYERQIEGQALVLDQYRAAPNLRARLTCLSNLINQINNLLRLINQVYSIFTGGIDVDAVMKALLAQLAERACNALNSYSGNMIYGYSAGYQQYLNGINAATYNVGRADQGPFPTVGNDGRLIPSGAPQAAQTWTPSFSPMGNQR